MQSRGSELGSVGLAETQVFLFDLMDLERAQLQKWNRFRMTVVKWLILNMME